MIYKLNSLKKKVKKLLLYGNELRGSDGVQLKFGKKTTFFLLKKITPYMIYGEPGITAFEYKNSIIPNYWAQ